MYSDKRTLGPDLTVRKSLEEAQWLSLRWSGGLEVKLETKETVLGGRI